MQVLLEKRDQGHGDMIIGDKVRTLLEVGPCQKENKKICVANVLMFTLVSYILSTALRLFIIFSIHWSWTNDYSYLQSIIL